MKIRSIHRMLAVLLASAALAWGVLSPGAPAQAAEFGARAYSLGGAFTAVADDISAILYNPAGVGRSSFEVSLSIGSNDFREVSKFQALLHDPGSFKDDASLSFTTFSGLSIGPFGAGVAADGHLSVHTTGCGGADRCAEGDYMTQLILGMSRSAARHPLGFADARFGLSLKRLDGRRITYTMTEDASGPNTYDVRIQEWQGQGYGVNLGATFQAGETLTIGVAAHDIISSITWTGTQKDETKSSVNHTLIGGPVSQALGSKTEQVGPVFRGGVAIRPPLLGATLAADLGSDGSVRLGVEKSLLFNTVALRLGQSSAGGESTTSAGIGFSFGPIQFDAAVGSSDGFRTYGTMIEGSVRF